jgi:small subunit ribosomal protein S21
MSSGAHPTTDAGKVFVRDNNVDQAMKVLKKKLQREGFFGELKKRRFHQSKAEKEREAKARSSRRQFKAAVRRTMKDNMVDKPTAIQILKGRSPR